MKEVVIVSAKRTPIGKFNGQLKDLSSVDLGTIATTNAIKSINLNPKMIDQVIFGNVLQAGAGQNVARQIELNSGIDPTSTATTVNQVCGSGMKAVRLGETAIKMGDANIVVVGGTESMSNVPFLNTNIRSTHKLGNITLEDGILKDGLIDAKNHTHMGITAENIANKFNISRNQQDNFALSSHKKATKAQNNNWFKKEIVPISIPNTEKVINKDEGVRPDTSLEKLQKLKPVFNKNGSVTAGNASSLNDGASALILMSKDKAKELGLKPIASLESYSEVGIDPNIMGYAPHDALKKLLEKNQSNINDYDLIELNEAYASQSLAVIHDSNIPMEKLNITGGAIALGHPLGDSGARIITTLIHNLHRTKKHKGIATLCIGGGMGMAYSIKC